MVARGFIGTGEAGYAPGGSAMISAMYPKEKRSWRMGLWNASIPLGAAIGVPLGGYLTDRWRKKRVNSRLLFPAISAILAAIICFIGFVVLTDTPQYITFLLMGMVITSFIPGAAAATQDLVHPGLRATSYSLAVVIQNLLGASMGPLVIGWISDRSDLETAMKTLPIFLVIASVLFFIGAMFYKKDLAKVEDVKIEVAD